MPSESRLPSGKPITSVQPHPTPLIAAVDSGQPLANSDDKRLHEAQMHSEIIGRGGLVDVIV